MPYEGERKFTSISVACPKWPHRIYKMSMEIVYTEKTDWIPFPCNGCDESFCGDNICMKCTAAVTELFIQDPLLLPHETFYPDLSKFE